MSLAENAVISNQLKEAVVGKAITRTVANQNPHSFVWFATEGENAFSGDRALNAERAAKYDGLLTGNALRKSDVIGAYGAWNFLYAGDRALMFNIPTRYFAPGEPLPKRHQLLLTLEDGASLAMCGSLGGPIFLFEVDGRGYPIVWPSHDFPSVLSDGFTEDFFLGLIEQTELRSLSAKAFLAARNRIPGIDNYILHELLWEAEVNPKSKMAALAAEDFKRMHAAIVRTFPAVIAAGGQDTEKDLYGNFGGYVTKASKNTLGKPCARCGAVIVKESYLGGAVYYCPGCQPVVGLRK